MDYSTQLQSLEMSEAARPISGCVWDSCGRWCASVLVIWEVHVRSEGVFTVTVGSLITQTLTCYCEPMSPWQFKSFIGNATF